ncbi:PH domain-containing protein [Nocardioides sp.]|uniref:PH domain-containing protein n=1 Tax=Nocardioides sp. TaxID=35761 RepID=UPI0039E5A736
MTALREPAHRVSDRAPTYWRVSALISATFAWLLAVVALVLALAVAEGAWRWLSWLAVVLLIAVPLPAIVVAPPIRFRVHRWEVTDIAVHVRYGWLSRTDEIVPLSRVQTVDSTQGPLMRLFGLRTVTVQTASAHGAVEIACLDDAIAKDTVERLVAITAATPEDAT